MEDVYRFTQSVEFLEDIDPLYLDGRVRLIPPLFSSITTNVTQVVESLDENHDILYSAYSCGFFFLSNRDFLYFEGNNTPIGAPSRGPNLIFSSKGGGTLMMVLKWWPAFHWREMMCLL